MRKQEHEETWNWHEGLHQKVYAASSSSPSCGSEFANAKFFYKLFLDE